MWRVLRRAAPIILVVLVLTLGWAFIFEVPDHLVPRDLVPNGTQRIDARHKNRATLLQSLVGVLVLFGAYITWQQIRVSREGQITERFTRAVDQLGNSQVDVRLGGLYALRRVVKDSPPDEVAITSILAAFIRGHAPWPPRLPGQYIANVPEQDMPRLAERAPDVQAALTILGGLQKRDIDPLDAMVHLVRYIGTRDPFWQPPRLAALNVESSPVLDGTDLRSADLLAPDFRYCEFNGANLEYSRIHWGNFDEACLIDGSLRDSDLTNCSFREADMRGAVLTGANLKDAKFQKANLRGANLDGAD